MIIEETTLTWLDSHDKLSFDELVKFSGLSQNTLQQLVESGVLKPAHLIEPSPNTTNINTDINAWHFSSHQLVSIRTLFRLKRDFELEENSLSLILQFLERIHTLELQLQHLDTSH